MDMGNDRRESDEHTYSLSIRRIRPEEPTLMQPDRDGNQEALLWPRFPLSGWKKNNQPMAGPTGRMNSASMSVLSRRIMATEWARALSGGFPVHHALAFRRRPNKLSRRVRG